MADVVAPYTDDQLQAESVSKKDIATFLQTSASDQFLVNHKLKGAIKNVIKTKTKEQLIDDYKDLFSTKDFRRDDEVPASPPVVAKESTESADVAKDVKKLTEKTKQLEVKAEEPAKYTKKILKNGNKSSFPKKGDEVECYYVGKLVDGKVFDSNATDAKRGKKNPPLKFKVGVGKVIRGWDEALLTMSVGEKAEVTIQPEWAYGKKGVEGKVPPNSTLIFEVELVNIR